MPKKQRTTIYDLGRIPATERKNTSGFEDSKSLLKRLQQEEVQAEEARRRAEYLKTPQGKLESELHAEFRANEERVRKFWSLPLEGENGMDSYSAADAPVDYIGGFEDRTQELLGDELRAIRDQFYSKLASHSCRLSENGMCRLDRYFLKMVGSRNLAVTVDAWYRAFERLADLDCFASGEVIGKIPKRAKAAKPQSETKSSDVIDYLLESTPAESHVWRNVVAQGWSADFSKWFYAWIESLKKNFDYDFPAEKLGPKAAAFLERWNLSPFAYVSWDKVRLAFVRSGDFPSHLLTDQERLSELIESSPLHDYETRRSIARWGQELINSGPTPPPHK